MFGIQIKSDSFVTCFGTVFGECVTGDGWSKQWDGSTKSSKSNKQTNKNKLNWITRLLSFHTVQ